MVSSDPAAQRQLELHLTGAASVRLAPSARIASLSLTDRPLSEILDAIAKAGGITLRYASGMSAPDAVSTITLSDQTVEDALRTALKGRATRLLRHRASARADTMGATMHRLVRPRV